VKIVIGYDGSDCAAGAIADLGRAGLFDETEAIVVAAADVFLPSGPEPAPAEMTTSPRIAEAVARARARARQAVAEAQAHAEEGASRLRTMFPAWKVSAEAVADAPYWAFIQRGEQWGADLIVVGSHGRSALARTFLGSVSQHVLHNAKCSVRIGRCADGGGASDCPARVVLAIDGSSDSATAASAVAARRWPQGSEVLVIGVIDLRLSTIVPGLAPALAGCPEPMWPVGATEDGVGHLRRALDAVADEIRRPGVVASTRLLEGDPKRVLVDEARAWNADCVFLGAKGHGRIERMIIGSVSAAVAARAHCSVEVVRAS
jgi:nucleotide-binding universal stress UspA family protein